MPFLHINSGPTGPSLHKTGAALRPALAKALSADTGPVIVMTHGYKFSPGHRACCPHEHILSLSPRPKLRKRISWPQKMGFGMDLPDEGVGIAFGWQGRGTIWHAYRQADAAGESLASLIGLIQRLSPGRPVHLMAHSLGARVVLSALQHLPEGSVSRVILLCGAEYSAQADACLSTGAGRTAEVFNITSRENDLFDFLLERLIAPPLAGDRCIGQGLPGQSRSVTLQLDHAGSLEVLARAGFDIPAPGGWICHWSSYLRSGVFDFYRALLRQPDTLPLAQLRAALPAQTDHRWSRLWSLPARLAVPFFRVTDLETRAMHIPAAPWADQTKSSSGGITMRTMNQ